MMAVVVVMIGGLCGVSLRYDTQWVLYRQNTLTSTTWCCSRRCVLLVVVVWFCFLLYYLFLLSISSLCFYLHFIFLALQSVSSICFFPLFLQSVTLPSCILILQSISSLYFFTLSFFLPALLTLCVLCRGWICVVVTPPC